MKRIGFGDFASYASLGAVAVIEAVNETLRLEPSMSAKLPSFVTSGVWHFVPLGLLCLVGLIWLGRQIWWPGGKRASSSSGGNQKTASKNYLIEPRVLAGFNNEPPSFHAKFARSGSNGVFYLDCSMGINPGEWTQRRSIQIRRVDRFAIGEDVNIPIVSKINVRAEDRWYFGVAPDLDANGWPKDMLGPSYQYRGCVRFLGPEDSVESCYLIAYSEKEPSKMPEVIGEHMFAHMFEWDGLPTRHGAL